MFYLWIQEYFKRNKMTINLKYIGQWFLWYVSGSRIPSFTLADLRCSSIADPTYMIRAIPSNASDNVYCTLLAHSVVHGAMAGYTGFTIGQVNGRHCYIPFYVSHRIFTIRTGSYLYRISASQAKFKAYSILLQWPLYWLSASLTPEDNREAEQSFDNRQDVGKAALLDQPAKLPVQQSCRRGEEGTGKDGPTYRWLAFPSEAWREGWRSQLWWYEVRSTSAYVVQRNLFFFSLFSCYGNWWCRFASPLIYPWPIFPGWNPVFTQC